MTAGTINNERGRGKGNKLRMTINHADGEGGEGLIFENLFLTRDSRFRS